MIKIYFSKSINLDVGPENYETVSDALITVKKSLLNCLDSGELEFLYSIMEVRLFIVKDDDELMMMKLVHLVSKEIKKYFRKFPAVFLDGNGKHYRITDTAKWQEIIEEDGVISHKVSRDFYRNSMIKIENDEQFSFLTLKYGRIFKRQPYSEHVEEIFKKFGQLFSKNGIQAVDYLKALIYKGNISWGILLLILLGKSKEMVMEYSLAINGKPYDINRMIYADCLEEGEGTSASESLSSIIAGLKSIKNL